MQLNVVQEGSRTEIQQYITFRYKFTGFHRIPRVSDVFRLSDLTVGSDTQQLPIGIRYQRFHQIPIGFLSEAVGNYRIPVGIYRITRDILQDPMGSEPGILRPGKRSTHQSSMAAHGQVDKTYSESIHYYDEADQTKSVRNSRIQIISQKY